MNFISETAGIWVLCTENVWKSSVSRLSEIGHVLYKWHLRNCARRHKFQHRVDTHRCRQQLSVSNFVALFWKHLQLAWKDWLYFVCTTFTTRLLCTTYVLNVILKQQYHGTRMFLDYYGWLQNWSILPLLTTAPPLQTPPIIRVCVKPLLCYNLAWINITLLFVQQGVTQPGVRSPMGERKGPASVLVRGLAGLSYKACINVNIMLLLCLHSALRGSWNSFSDLVQMHCTSRSYPTDQ